MESRREFLWKAGVSGAALWAGRAFAQDKPPAVEAMKAVDVTEDWSKLYANPKAAPGTQYRSGHVTPSSQKAELEKTESGFSIQLPGRTPVPTPALYSGKLFVSGGFHGKQYFCFDAESGKPLWAVDLDDDGPSTAAVEDDLAVVNTESCTIFTLEASTGKMVWSLWLGDPLMTAPTIARGRVFTAFPAPAGRAHHKEASHLLGAFDLKTGRILWQRWIDGDVISAPVASGDEVIAATFTGTVFRFKQESGELLSALKARATSAPVVIGQEMHFSQRSEASGAAEEALCYWDNGGGRSGSRYGGKAARYLDRQIQDHAEMKESAGKLDSGNGFSAGAPETAKVQLAVANVGQSNVATLQAFQGSRVLRMGGSNYSCRGDEVVCNDPKDGKTIWSVKLKGDLKKVGGFLGSPPVAAGESLFMTTLAGAVLKLDPKTGETRKSWEIGHEMRFPPAVVKGCIYASTQDGRVVCVRTGEAGDTGWPQWGANAQRTGLPPAK